MFNLSSFILEWKMKQSFILEWKMKQSFILEWKMEAFELEKGLVQLGKWRSGRRYDRYCFLSKFRQNLALSCGCVCRPTEGHVSLILQRLAVSMMTSIYYY